MKMKNTMKRILQTMGFMGIVFGLQLYTAQVYGSQAPDSPSVAAAPNPGVPVQNGLLREWLANSTPDKILAFYILMMTNKAGSSEALASAKAAMLEKFGNKD